MELTDEHTIPEALGGTRTVKNVCRKCNNESLSELDRVLCSDSYLSLIIGREMEKRISHLWEVDPAADYLLLEGKFDQNADCMKLFPQIIFDPMGKGKFQIRGEGEEFFEIGPKAYQKKLVEHILEAFEEDPEGSGKRTIFQKVKHFNLPSFYRLPPRVYVAHPLKKLKKRNKVILRYQNDDDKRTALRGIASWDREHSFNSVDSRAGTDSPPVQAVFDPHKVMRALLKIGLNLVAHECPNTPIERVNFGEVISVIKGEKPITGNMFLSNGFTPPAELSALEHKSDTHCFWLTFDGTTWSVYSSFFGGKMKAVVRFKGASNEPWSFRKIEVPLVGNKKHTWVRSDEAIIPGLQPQVEWRDLSILAPSLKLKNGKAFEFRVNKRAA